MKSVFALILISILLLLSCSEETTKPNDNGPLDNSIYSISGSLNNVSNVEITETARLVAIWYNTWDGTDYGYFWTEGEIDLQNNSFKISFDENPPDSCLNHGEGFRLGVCLIAIVDDFIQEEGLVDSNPYNKFIGLINDRAIIYLDGDFQEIENRFINFDEGFNFGKGWYNPEPGFDGWESTATDSLEILIDSLENFTFPNWT